MCLFVHPAREEDPAQRLFEAVLGVAPSGLAPRGAGSGPVCYWAVEDIRASLQQLLDAGAELVHDVRSVGPGRQIAQVKNAQGSTVALLQDSV